MDRYIGMRTMKWRGVRVGLGTDDMISKLRGSGSNTMPLDVFAMQ